MVTAVLKDVIHNAGYAYVNGEPISLVNKFDPGTYYFRYPVAGIEHLSPRQGDIVMDLDQTVDFDKEGHGKVVIRQRLLGFFGQDPSVTAEIQLVNPLYRTFPWDPFGELFVVSEQHVVRCGRGEYLITNSGSFPAAVAAYVKEISYNPKDLERIVPHFPSLGAAYHHYHLDEPPSREEKHQRPILLLIHYSPVVDKIVVEVGNTSQYTMNKTEELLAAHTFLKQHAPKRSS